MDLVSVLDSWKRLLEDVESSDNRINTEDLLQLTDLFKHLPTEVAPRLQKEYDSCMHQSSKLFEELFDKIDLSDKPLLCTYLKMLSAYGYFKLAHITYQIGKFESLEHDIDSPHFPSIDKCKWYSLTPLLPEAGTITWKAIMNHGLVREEPDLFHTCLQLLSQKLHFYSIAISLDKYQEYEAKIRKNGEKVVEKLFELIRDVAYDDDSMIGLDSFIFNLLTPFTSQEQQAAIIDAIVQDLFKPYFLQRSMPAQEVVKVYELVDSSLINHIQFQNFLTIKLLENLRSNIIRRKRRHSVENQEEGLVTLETLLDCVRDENLGDALSKVDELELSSKSFQTGYLTYWIEVVDRILTRRTLRAVNSLKLLGTCSIILVAASKCLNEDLIAELTSLMAKIIDYTGTNRNDKLFNAFDTSYLVELTKAFSEKTNILTTFDSPVQKFYKSYFNRYIIYCMLRVDKTESEKMNRFISFICDKNLNKETSHLLQYVCIHEIANCLEGRGSNRLMEIYLDCARNCGKKLYRFIKRNLSIKESSLSENGNKDEDMDGINKLDTSHDDLESISKKKIVIDALVCILRIAIERKDQEMLDMYGDLLLKLSEYIVIRVEKLINAAKNGKSTTPNSLDLHLPKLLILYRDHKELIQGYINFDLFEKLADLLLNDISTVDSSVDSMKNNKKLVYNQIKTKLENLEERASRSTDVYPLIINKQYNSVVEQSIKSGDIKKEKSCCRKYLNEMKTLHRIYSIVFTNCEISIYKKVLVKKVTWLEKCDPLDHPKLLYLLLILETLIPKQISQSKSISPSSESFRDRFQKISTSLIRVTKSVELGPSIHTFTNSGSHKSNKGIQCCTYANCIKLITQIFIRYSTKFTNPLITDAMQLCVSSNINQYAKYSDRMQRFFIQLSSAITGLLRSMCIDKKEEEMLKSSMPIFLNVFSNLIRCVIIASDRRKLSSHSKPLTNGHGEHQSNGDFETDEKIPEENVDYENQLKLLALDIARMLNNLSFLKVKLVDFAPHLICTYVKDIQRASCPDFVKLHINEGMFRIFNLIDAHQRERHEDIVEAGIQRKTTAGRASGSLFEMIHARLDQASREIFKDMHDDYNRFHRYQGKC